MSEHAERGYALDHALIIARPSFVRVSEKPTSLQRSLVNLAPLLVAHDPRFRPHHVVLISDQTDREYVRSVERIITSLEIKVTVWEVNVRNLELASHTLNDKLGKLEAPLPLVLSPHAPLLSSVASAVFQERKAPFLHVIGTSLYRLGCRPQRTRLEPVIDLPLILNGLGSRVTGGSRGSWSERHLKELSIYLVGVGQGCVAPLEVIQRLARQADDEHLLSPLVKGTEVAIPLFQELLDRFESAGCLELNQGRLLFSSPEHRVFCAGGWLVDLVQALLYGQGERIRVLCALQALRLELAYPTPLEITIPLTVVLEGQLVLFFCMSSIDQQLNELLRSISSLRFALGAEVVLLSLDHLTEEQSLSAMHQGVRVCAGEGLRSLNQWLNNEFGKQN